MIHPPVAIRLTIAASLLLCMVPAVSPAAEPKLTIEPRGPFKLKEAGYDFALDPDTGNLAAVNEARGTAMLYLPEYFQGDESKVLGPVDIGEKPSSIIFKKHGTATIYAIGCLADNHIHLLDSTTFKSIGKIDVGGRTSLLGTAEDDPYIYYARPRSHSQARIDPKELANDPNATRILVRNRMATDEDVVGRVDITTMADEGIVCEQATSFAVSPDGTRIYFRRDGTQVDGRYLDILGRSPSGVATKHNYWEHKDTRPYNVDPRGRYIFALGDHKIYSTNLRRVIGSFRSGPVEVAIFKTRPIIAGVNNGGTMIFYSYDTLEGRASIRLPRPMAPDYEEAVGRRARGFLPRKHLHADERNGQVVLANRDQVIFFPLGDVGDNKVPFDVTVRSPKPVLVDRPNTISLSLSVAGAKVELPTPVPGLSVVDGGLQWTPTNNQLGEHSIPLRAMAGDVSVETVIELEVMRPHATVPFAAGDCCVGPEGRLAAVWSGEIGSSIRSSSTSRSRKGWKQHLALVDLKENRVLAKTSLPAPITAAAVDRHNVYVAMAWGRTIEARSHKDLSKTNVAYLAEAVPIHAIRSIADKYLVAVTGYGDTVRFSLPDLKACDPPRESAARPGQPGYRHRQLQPSPSIPVEDLGAWIYCDGRVYDKATGRPCLICSPPSDDKHHIITLGAEPQTSSNEDRTESRPGTASTAASTKSAAAPLLWNRRLRAPGPYNSRNKQLLLETSTGRKITTVDANTLLLNSVPLMVTSHGTRSPYKEGSGEKLAPGQGDRPATSTTYRELAVKRPTVDLDVCELLSGKQRERIRLFCDMSPYNASYQLPHCMRVGGATVAVLYRHSSRRHPHQRLRTSVVLPAGEEPELAPRGRSRVYSYTFQTAGHQKLVPPGFQPVQSTLAVSGSRSTTLTHRLTACAEDARFELVDPGAGISIDATTGNVTVDGPELTKLMLSKITNGRLTIPALPTRSSSRAEKVQSVTVESYREKAASVFEDLVGRELQGLPALVPIKILMKTGETRVAQLSYFVFLEAPTTELDKSLAAERLKQLEGEFRSLEQRLSTSEDTLARIREGTALLQRDAKTAASSLALELRIRLLRSSLHRASEQVRNAREQLKANGD